jgi:hypothetical protein
MLWQTFIHLYRSYSLGWRKYFMYTELKIFRVMIMWADINSLSFNNTHKIWVYQKMFLSDMLYLLKYSIRLATWKILLNQ